MAVPMDWMHIQYVHSMYDVVQCIREHSHVAFLADGSISDMSKDEFRNYFIL